MTLINSPSTTKRLFKFGGDMSKRLRFGDDKVQDNMVKYSMILFGICLVGAVAFTQLDLVDKLKEQGLKDLGFILNAIFLLGSFLTGTVFWISALAKLIARSNFNLDP